MTPQTLAWAILAYSFFFILMRFSFKPQAIAGLLGVALLLMVLVMGAQARPTGSHVAGQTYVEAMIGAPHRVNPLLATSDTDLDLTHLVYSGLSRVDSQGKLVPDLASGWIANGDSTVFTFTLKPNLHWQDGVPLTVADVAFTLNLLQSADFPGDPVLALPWRGVDITSTVDTLVLQAARVECGVPAVHDAGHFASPPLGERETGRVGEISAKCVACGVRPVALRADKLA